MQTTLKAMDAISQTVFGALTAEAVTPQKDRGRVPLWIVGAFAGLMPDFDVIFRSATDPLFATVMHRGFTHAIVTIPLGGTLAFLVFFYWLRKERRSWLPYWIACCAAYGTHWILDVLTAYGTQIFWPFTQARYAVDVMSIVDPIATGLMIFGVAFSIRRRNPRPARLAMIFLSAYFLLCTWNHHRATQALASLAQSRGHTIERYRVLPTLGNSMWFRSIYLHQGKIYADGILIRPWAAGAHIRHGKSVDHFDVKNWSAQSEAESRHLRTWSWFTDDWTYVSRELPLELGDGRYSSQPESFQSLWVFRIESHVPYSAKKVSNFQADDPVAGRNPFEGFQLALNPSSLDQLPD